jgi:uncharacterized protein YggU (UPF0235/DUF167 family)
MIVKAKVVPKSKINLIEQAIVDNGELSMVIRVTAIPDKGAANSAVIKLLAKFLDINQSSVDLIKGYKCRNKVFRVTNVRQEFLNKILLIK